MTTADQPGGLADVLDDHLAAEFATRDLDATMATMTDDPYLNHVPVMTGGIGRDEVRRFWVVAGFEDGKLTHEHIYWDQASLLVQLGLLDRAGLPVTGAEQAEKLLAPRAVPANSLLGPDWPEDRPEPSPAI